MGSADGVGQRGTAIVDVTASLQSAIGLGVDGPFPFRLEKALGSQNSTLALNTHHSTLENKLSSEIRKGTQCERSYEY